MPSTEFMRDRLQQAVDQGEVVRLTGPRSVSDPGGVPMTNKALGDLLRRLRRGLRLSQAAVAERMSARGFNFYVTTIGRIERGERSLQAVELIHLLDEFDVSADEFLTPSGDDRAFPLEKLRRIQAVLDDN